MKQKTKALLRKWIWPINWALLFVVFAGLACTQIALSKYTSTGQGAANARLAKFDPVVTFSSTWPTTAGNKFVLFNDAIGKTNAYTNTFSIKNNGETLIKATPRLVNAANGAVFPGVTFSPANSVIGIGSAVTFTMTVAYDSTLAVATEYTCELRVLVEQVD